MNNLLPRLPLPFNEPVRAYAPGSPERASLLDRLQRLRDEPIEIPAFIGGEAVITGSPQPVTAPHDHSLTLATVHACSPADTEKAIQAALDARRDWMNMPWTERAAVFLKAAELLAGPWRDTLNAASMLGQSKNVFQAEIDAACEMIDFFRFNAAYMAHIYSEQPNSPPGSWNQLQYRPLEGFVLAVTPFNFTSIQGNLPTAPAMMGNTVLWKPSSTSVLSAYYTYRLLEAAGLPPGVINMLPGPGPAIGTPALSSRHFAGLHFTGSTGTFQNLWKMIGTNIDQYASYPRIVGETGGKDFIVAHPSADALEVATAIVRGGFEYQGQKCSAASRVYLPASLWPAVEEAMVDQLSEIRMGPVEDLSNFVNAVIDQSSYDKITSYIHAARRANGVDIVFGGNHSDEHGFFIEPTVLRVQDPMYRTMQEEIFGPVVTIYVYEDRTYVETLDLIDRTSPYALTGAVFSRDRNGVRLALEHLVEAAGNFYINDKPTGAVVGQQPFGGARASGTNDKAGSYLNLVRWVSARSIKETFVPPRHYAYPFLASD